MPQEKIVATAINRREKGFFKRGLEKEDASPTSSLSALKEGEKHSWLLPYTLLLSFSPKQKNPNMAKKRKR